MEGLWDALLWKPTCPMIVGAADGVDEIQKAGVSLVIH